MPIITKIITPMSPIESETLPPKIILDIPHQIKYNNIMDLVIEHIGDLFLMLALLFGFILIAYVNVSYVPGEESDDEDDRF